MSHGFNTDKSNANIEDMIIVQQINITMSAEIPPYQDAEMGGWFDLTEAGVIPAGYKPVGIVGWNCPNATSLRTCYMANATVPYDPAIHYGVGYTLTNINAGSGKKTFSVTIMLLKIVD